MTIQDSVKVGSKFGANRKPFNTFFISSSAGYDLVALRLPPPGVRRSL